MKDRIFPRPPQPPTPPGPDPRDVEAHTCGYIIGSLISMIIWAGLASIPTLLTNPDPTFDDLWPAFAIGAIFSLIVNILFWKPR